MPSAPGIFAWLVVRQVRSQLNAKSRERRYSYPHSEHTMLYMVIEHFRNGDPVPVYRRFRDAGRSLPEGLSYVSSWVTDDLSRCYQIMDTARRELLDEWAAQWTDLVEFEFIAVVTSAEARAVVAPRL